jgi:hypothetical protein
MTETEWEDWSRDTGAVFAPITAIPISLIYCALNLITAVSVRLLIKHFHKRRTILFFSSDNVTAG